MHRPVWGNLLSAPQVNDHVESCNQARGRRQGLVHSLVAAAAALFIAPASSLNTVPRPQVPTLLYVLAQKVAIVGFSPITFANGPPRLYASTNLVNWSDVTPTGATALPKGRTTWSRFDDASFISPSTGWVATWNPGSLQEVVYGTRDAGQRWRPLFTAFHGDSAGDAYWLQLLTPELAFSQTVTANGPGQRLEVTTDGGRTWMTVYTGPHGNQGEGPFEMPTVFRPATGALPLVAYRRRSPRAPRAISSPRTMAGPAGPGRARRCPGRASARLPCTSSKAPALSACRSSTAPATAWCRWSLSKSPDLWSASMSPRTAAPLGGSKASSQRP